MTEETLFTDALNLPAHERAEFLAKACAGDMALYRRLEALLTAYDPADGFLEAPVANNGHTGPFDPVGDFRGATIEKPGSRIGPYRLLEQIGEGGFGIVFMAEQLHPIRRKVALKIVKPGMDTRQVVARFEAERQALALMDHPNIAHVFDGGETESGRPFFVMELVRGIPITDYCDQSRVSIRERLDLFINVCHAVQHAHQKGIIHRDLKPSNILITLHDGKPVVKVIDFGIAKATGQQLTDKTLFTGFAQLIGTPMYMSPEQAALSGLDVDTRSDIYSLGVLLYELLTGATPFDKETMRTAAYEEIRRIIREVEPQKPSTRLTTLGNESATVCANRCSDSKHLRQMLKGELDWIVLKALEKDRNRRYETIGAFAADVQRFLCDEPVHACPPSVRYRLQKFLRRNKGRVTAASLILMALVAGIIGTSWGLVEALKQKRQAKQQASIAEAVNDFFHNDLLLQTNTDFQTVESADRDPDVKVRTLLDRASKSLDGRFTEQPLTEAAIRMTLAETYAVLGAPIDGLIHAERAVALRSAALGPSDSATIEAKIQQAVLCNKLQRLDEAESLCREVLSAPARLMRDSDSHIQAKTMTAYVATGRGHYDRARMIFEEARADCTVRFGENNGGTQVATLGLADTWLHLQQYERAAPLYSAVLEWRSAHLGSDQAPTQKARKGLADCYRKMGKYDLAEPLYVRIIETGNRLHPSHDYLIATKASFGFMRRQQGKYKEAESLLREALDVQRARYGEQDSFVISIKVNLAAVVSGQRRDDEGIRLLVEAFEGARAKLGPANSITQDAVCDLIIGYENMNRHDLAEPLLQYLSDFWTARSGPFASTERPRLGTLGRWLLNKKRYAEAEAVLRVRLIMCDKIDSELMSRILTRLQLGIALLQQDRVDEAESFLTQANDALTQQISRIPKSERAELTATCRQLAELFDKSGQLNQADTWRQFAIKLTPTGN